MEVSMEVYLLLWKYIYFHRNFYFMLVETSVEVDRKSEIIWRARLAAKDAKRRAVSIVTRLAIQRASMKACCGRAAAP